MLRDKKKRRTAPVYPVSPDIPRAKTTENRERIKKHDASRVFSVSETPGYGHSIATHTPHEDENRRDRRLLQDSRLDDFAVFESRINGPRLVGFVRKADGRILYRHVTENGCSPWHVAVGCKTKLPEKVMRTIFDVPYGINAYMTDVRHVLKVQARNDRAEIAEAGPHDRLPQQHIYSRHGF